MTKPRLSVILPVYNGMRYLEESVASVLSQEFADFELIIIDDTSTDESYSYLKSLQDPRLIILQNGKNCGLFFTLNRLVAQAHAPLVKLWAQDDRMQPGCLAAFYDFHQQHPQIGMSYCAIDYINEKGIKIIKNQQDTTPTIISRDEHALIAYSTGSIAGNISNVCLTQAALQQVGLFNSTMTISADFDMWVHIAEYFDIGYIKTSWVEVRDHLEQLSRNESLYSRHILEDVQVYQYLNSYVPTTVRDRGKLIMRKQKLVFYFTMMVKLAARGRWKAAYTYYTMISKLDHVWLVAQSFLRAKFFSVKKTSDNTSH